MISIVIPVYNEEGGIVDILKEVKRVMSSSRIKHEIIVVDDGSTDKTADLVKGVRKVKLIQHPYNKGYGAALKTGTKSAEGEWILYIDADREHNPEDILRIIEHIENYDMVVGARTKKSKTPFFRRPAKKILNIMANYLSGRKIPDLNSGFRIIKKEIVLQFLHILPDTFSFTTTITLACIKSGYNIKYVPIETAERLGKSKVSPSDFLRFVKLILRTIILFDPLKVFLPISLLLFLVGFIYGIYTMVLYLNLTDPSVFLMVSGVMIFFFGLLADGISMLQRKLSDGTIR